MHSDLHLDTTAHAASYLRSKCNKYLTNTELQAKAWYSSASVILALERSGKEEASMGARMSHKQKQKELDKSQQTLTTTKNFKISIIPRLK